MYSSTRAITINNVPGGNAPGFPKLTIGKIYPVSDFLGTPAFVDDEGSNISLMWLRAVRDARDDESVVFEEHTQCCPEPN